MIEYRKKLIASLNIIVAVSKQLICFVVGHDWKHYMIPASEKEWNEYRTIRAPIEAAWETKRSSREPYGTGGKPASVPPYPSPTYFERCRRCLMI